VRATSHVLTRDGSGVSRGQLSLEFTTDEAGRSFLSHQYASYPFHVCKALYQDADLPKLATLYVQSCSGGLYGGDRHSISLFARKGSEVHLTTQASTIVHSMPDGHASQATDIVAKEGSYIEFLPDPLILFPRSNLSSQLRVTIAEGATVVVLETFLIYDLSSDAAPNLYSSEISIQKANGRPAAIDRLRLCEEAFMMPRRGVLGAFAAQGTMLVATDSLFTEAIKDNVRAFGSCSGDCMVGASLLPNMAGCIARFLAQDGASLRRVMHALWSIVRAAKYGHPPSSRRK